MARNDTGTLVRIHFFIFSQSKTLCISRLNFTPLPNQYPPLQCLNNLLSIFCPNNQTFCHLTFPLNFLYWVFWCGRWEGD